MRSYAAHQGSWTEHSHNTGVSENETFSHLQYARLACSPNIHMEDANMEDANLRQIYCLHRELPEAFTSICLNLQKPSHPYFRATSETRQVQ